MVSEMFNMGGITSGALSTGIIVAVIIMGGGVILGLWFAYTLWKKYSEFVCIIFEKDGANNTVINFDQAGIFVDKLTNNKRFFMKKHNVGLTPDNIPYIPVGKKKWVFLQRDGFKNFRYLKIGSIGSTAKLIVTEEDVNWGINAYERQKKLFQSSTLMQLLPYIALVVVSFVIMIIFIYFFKDFAVLKEVALALRDTANVMAGIKGNSTVILP